LPAHLLLFDAQQRNHAGGTMKVSQAIAELGSGFDSAFGTREERVHRLTPRRRYPTVRVKPFRRGPLSRLAWIFGLSR
jgi:hypothetical protein